MSNLSYAAPGDAYAPSSSTNAQGKCAAFLYDANGNQTDSYAGLIATGTGASRQCNGGTSGNRTQASYNSNGTVATTTDPNGNVTSYGYDTHGNLTSINYQAPLGDPTYTPDAVSRIGSMVDGKGQTTTYTYDNLDRITRVTYNGDTTCTSRATCIDYVFDDDGNLTSRIDTTGTTSFVYDRLNRPISKTLPGSLNGCTSPTGSAMTMIYDGVGNLIGYCDKLGKIVYSYDPANQLTGLALPGGSCTGTVSKCVTFGYDNKGSADIDRLPDYQSGEPDRQLLAFR